MVYIRSIVYTITMDMGNMDRDGRLEMRHPPAPKTQNSGVALGSFT